MIKNLISKLLIIITLLIFLISFLIFLLEDKHKVSRLEYYKEYEITERRRKV